MPRDGSGIYHKPIGTDGLPDTVVESASYNNYVYDVEIDLNRARPIVAGGTGASTLADAHVSLKAASFGQQVDNYSSFVFEQGFFWSDTNAVGGPVSGHHLAGKYYALDATNAFIELRDLDDGANPGWGWVRQLKAGVWGPWVRRDYNGDVTRTPIYVGQAVTYTPQTLTDPQKAQARSNIGVANIAGDTIDGGLTVNGNFTVNGADLQDIRTGNPATGIIWLGNTGHYLFFDGSNYVLAGGGLYDANGRIWGTSDFGAPLQLSGGTMSGVINTAQAGGTIQQGGNGNALYIPGNPHAYITFYVPGSFIANFGQNENGDYYMGGGSYGAVAYKFWTTRDFAQPGVDSMRLAMAGDIGAAFSGSTVDSWGGAVVTGGSTQGGAMYFLRFRYFQFHTASGWVTASYV